MRRIILFYYKQVLWQVSENTLLEHLISHWEISLPGLPPIPNVFEMHSDAKLTVICLLLDLLKSF